ncbi:MAG: MFS transporter [Actinomycetia bacterium]|nr:MFS transporter [Actinomycetes bacterium]
MGTTEETQADSGVAGDPLAGLSLASEAPIGWRITIVCSIVALLETTAVGMAGGSLTAIQETFGLSDTLAGLIPSAAVLGSLAAAVPSAHLADNHKRVLVLGAAAVLWTLVVVGSALAPVFAVFLFTRVLLGAAGQLNNPAASSLIADAHPARARARAYGYERMANYLGLPLGIAVGAALSDAFGWRTAFVVLAAPGVLAVLAVLTLREPARGLGDMLDRRGRELPETAAAGDAPASADVEAGATDDDGDGRPPTIAQFRMLWAIPTMRILLVGIPVLFSALASLFFWSTAYFEEVHSLAESEAGGIAGGVGGTGIVIGIIIGSRMGDRHHGNRAGWRLRLAGTALLAGSAFFAAFVLLPSLPAQAAAFGMSNVFIAMAIPNLTAAVADVVPAHMRGMAFSSVQFLLAFGSAAGPPLVGATSDLFGSLRPAMAVLLIPLAISAEWVRRGAHRFDDDAEAVISNAR